MDKYRFQILFLVILCGGVTLYTWDLNDKRAIFRKETEKIVGHALPQSVKIIDGYKSELWMQSDVTVFFQAPDYAVRKMAEGLKPVSYDDVCAKASQVRFIDKFQPTQCFYLELNRINMYFMYIFWSPKEKKGVLYWTKK